VEPTAESADKEAGSEANVEPTAKSAEKSGDEVGSEAPSGQWTTVTKKKKKSRGASQRRRHRQQLESEFSATALGAAGPSHGAKGSDSQQTPATQSASDVTRPAKRRAEDTPPNKGRPVAKQTRQGTPKGSSYKTAADCALQIFIGIKGDPWRQVSPEMGDHIRQQLIAAMGSAPDGQPPLRFNQSGIVQGHFKVSCADQHALDWLKTAVPAMPALEGVKFTPWTADQLPRLVKVRVYIPGPEKDLQSVRTMLARQNPELKAERWVFYHKDVMEPPGTLHTLGVDEASLAALRRLDFRPYYELSRVAFQVPRKAGK